MPWLVVGVSMSFTPGSATLTLSLACQQCFLLLAGLFQDFYFDNWHLVTRGVQFQIYRGLSLNSSFIDSKLYFIVPAATSFCTYFLLWGTILLNLSVNKCLLINRFSFTAAGRWIRYTPWFINFNNVKPYYRKFIKLTVDI